jgi:hypothetical protein
MSASTFTDFELTIVLRWLMSEGGQKTGADAKSDSYIGNTEITLLSRVPTCLMDGRQRLERVILEKSVGGARFRANFKS